MTSGKITLNDASNTNSVSLQAPATLPFNANLTIKVITLTRQYVDYVGSWNTPDTTEGKNYVIVGGTYGVWATPITGIYIDHRANLRHLSSLTVDIGDNGGTTQVKQGGDWVNPSPVPGDILYFYVIES